MGIGTKLVAVMKACRIMSKDGRNTYQGYSYATAAGMFAKINEALTEQNLFIAASELNLLELRDATTSKGNAEKHAVVQAKITIADAETGEQVTFAGIGSGQDSGDKAIMKGNTAALKYAYIAGLDIAMADDPEYDTRQPEEPTQAKSKPKSNGNNAGFAGKCEACGAAIKQNVLDYSTKKFGKPLCMDCQKKSNGTNEPF